MADEGSDTRRDPWLGTRVHVVASRQSRPNLPANDCPFCPGGLEAPGPYDVRWFPNRWPPMPDDRCEVVLYSPDHDASLTSLGTDGVLRVVDLWAERTAALKSRSDVEYVLVFENRGSTVGATIGHPHGQIYAFDHVPERPGRMLGAGWNPDSDPGERLVLDGRGFAVYAQDAAVHPVALTVASKERVPDLPSMDAGARRSLARTLGDILGRLDRLHDGPLPYMMWLNQSPRSGHADSAWFNIEIVSPMRAPGVQRFVAAAEIATWEYFNPVRPEDLAAQLRDLA
ncbi:MAG: galactose-1-phosphate uridylyltransferase [Acidimicrobiales bacterium]